MLRAALGAMRMAGSKINAFDKRYADDLVKFIQGKNPGAVRGVLSVGAGIPLSSAGKMATTAATDGIGLKLAAAGLNYGAPAASAALRYGVPLAGLGLAHKGIQDVWEWGEKTPLLPGILPGGSANPMEPTADSQLMIRYAPGASPSELPM